MPRELLARIVVSDNVQTGRYGIKFDGEEDTKALKLGNLILIGKKRYGDIDVFEASIRKRWEAMPASAGRKTDRRILSPVLGPTLLAVKVAGMKLSARRCLSSAACSAPPRRLGGLGRFSSSGVRLPPGPWQKSETARRASDIDKDTCLPGVYKGNTHHSHMWFTVHVFEGHPSVVSRLAELHSLNLRVEQNLAQQALLDRKAQEEERALTRDLERSLRHDVPPISRGFAQNC